MNKQTKALRDELAQLVLGIRQYLWNTEFAPEPFTECADDNVLLIGFPSKILQACEEAGLQFAEEVGTTIYERQSDHAEVSQCILIPIDLEEA